MKGSTLLATMRLPGIKPSFSRPHVSDDNAFAEALFRTLKYRPEYPTRPFESLDAARRWVDAFVAWYNEKHLHGALNFVTPCTRHQGRDRVQLAVRHALYVTARGRNPRRWTGATRNWSPAGDVILNPARSHARVERVA